MTTSKSKPVFEYRPRRSRLGSWITAAVFFLTFAALSFSLSATTEGGGVMTPADHFAMWGLGVLGALAFLVFSRPRIRVFDHGIEVRNLGSAQVFPWEVVTGLSFPKGVPWATLELADDDEVSLMALQPTDKERALEATRTLRARIDAHRN
ncbi:PH domain-containing protein [Haloglycomyces albus]|uniref:PH domain-containing protein n=1 Tax=Haloglycomyces albus TaxID=526067 RepID=UPI0004A29704|nr:PH domain-containing protein [Haloglycomyces albus]